MNHRPAMDEIPAYSDLFGHVLDALKELGGSGRASEVRDYLASELKLSDSALEVTIKSGEQLFRNRIQWARFYLAKSGYICSSKRGVWSLTETGRQVVVNDDMKRAILANAATAQKPGNETTPSVEQSAEQLDCTEPADAGGDDHRGRIMELLYAMTPGAFERLCQKLLRESGFEQVVVTGKSGDGGIDGHGVLQLNAFVSFRVLFQCKRYRGTVSSGAVRDFRGAMTGRTDKGIVMTTGTFSREAEREAKRDGAPPIELVDGNALINLFEKLEFGLVSQQVFQVDEKFFSGFEA